MSKSQRPAIENPLASLGLDEIVRGITSETDEARMPVKQETPAVDNNETNLFATSTADDASAEKQEEVIIATETDSKVAVTGNPTDEKAIVDVEAAGTMVAAEDSGVRRLSRSRKNTKKILEENLSKYTRLSEQGVAIWLPKEVKKKLELIRVNAKRTIPLRALAAAIITAYLAENDDIISEL